MIFKLFAILKNSKLKAKLLLTYAYYGRKNYSHINNISHHTINILV